MADTDEKVGLKPLDGRLTRARTLAKLLDSAGRVPGTNIRFGLDSLLGLVPGLGDAAGALFSGYLILLGSRLGLPKDVITKMVVNVAIDTAVGAIPLFGDMFDIAWKANTKNMKLLEQSVDPVYEQEGIKWPMVLGALTLLLLLVAAGIWLAIIAIKALINTAS